MALFFRGGSAGGGADTQQRQQFGNLQAMIDAATGGRLGIRTGHRSVGWHGALSIPAVWSAVRLRANVIGSLPVQVLRDMPDGTTKQVDTPNVLDQPSATFDIMSWLHASQLSLDLRGNAYGKIVARDPRTFLPTQVELVHPDDVSVTTNKRTGEIVYRFSGNKVDPFDVWHERQNEQPGDVCGMSPIAACARSLGINLASVDYGAGFYDEALTASGLLSSDAPIDETEAKIVKARVLAVQAGREPLVLGGNWDYKPLTINPAEAMFLEVLKFGATEVAQIFDVPAEMIDANSSGSSITYANREQRVQDLLAFRLGPAIARRERSLTRFTVRGQKVKLNVGALLRGDLITRYQSYQIALRNGFMSLDEPRMLEDRAPLTPEQLDQLQAAGLLGARVPGAPPPALPGQPIPADDEDTTGVTIP